MGYKYNYIFFDSGNINDVDDYYYICTEDLRKENNTKVVTFPLDYTNSLLHNLFILTNYLSKKLQIGFPRKIWFPFYFKVSKFKEKLPFCFIVYGYYIKPDYLRFLKKKYPDCKIVKLHRDSYNIWRKKNPEFTDKDMATLFDLQMSYDLGDSEKLGMIHFDEIESITHVEASDEYPIHDIFFAGAAKDRLPILIEVYDYLECNGFKPYFYLTNVAENERIQREGIVYSMKNMTYREMLYHTVNSKVVLEINQGCVDGFTSRFLESVMYNKRLLTNNFAVQKNKYYDPTRIQCFKCINDIDLSFINDPSPIEYNYQGEFSPKHLIKFIEDNL